MAANNMETGAIEAALDAQQIEQDGPPNSGPDKLDSNGNILRFPDALNIEARLDEIAARMSRLPKRERARMLRLIESCKRWERRAQRNQARISTRGR